ncbi:hypothetical protein PgNI_10130, partial [Pyricularia grisea]|uniref:Nephrocystin 3-like N-terminal domain-containing protein n=1 Tax=Pyricularia grisea TaxID=148305 RepID=A0A6P8AZP5_PYRGI
YWTWLTEEPVFQSWIERRSRILWILGGPGAGKSHLAAWLIAHLSEKANVPGDTRASQIVYFFVKSYSDHLCDLNNILKALAWQLCKNNATFEAHVAAACRDSNPTYTPEDTCEKRFFLLDRSKNHNDIDSYVKRQLEQVQILRRMRRVKPQGKQDANAAGAYIRKQILLGANGSFLWARLVIDTIINKDIAQIEEVLREPPSSLDDIYDRVFLDRFAKNQDLEKDSTRRMPLELDFFLGLAHWRPNLLLWEGIRGTFSAFFDLEFPKGKDPDAVEKKQNATTVQKRDDMFEDSSDGGFDFTGVPEEETDSGLVATSSADSALWEVPLWRRNAESKHRDQLNDGQLNTKITLCHARSMDFVQREGRSTQRDNLVHAIIPEMDRAQVDRRHDDDVP